jgi:hypothetical protein
MEIVESYMIIFGIYLIFLIPFILLIRKYGWKNLYTFNLDISYVGKYHLGILELAG